MEKLLIQGPTEDRKAKIEINPDEILNGKKLIHLGKLFTLSYNSIRFNGQYKGIKRDNVVIAVWNDEKWLKCNKEILFNRAMDLLRSKYPGSLI